MAVQKVVVSRIPPPSEEQLRHFEQFGRDFHYLATIADELAEEHPGEWVCVYKGEIITIDGDEKRFFATIEERGVPAAHAVCMYLFPPDEIVIL